MLLMILTRKKLLEPFTKKNCKNQIKKSLKLNGYKNFFNGWIDKKDIVKMKEYFPKPKPLRVNVRICLIMQQKQIKKMPQELIHWILLKRLI